MESRDTYRQRIYSKYARHINFKKKREIENKHSDRCGNTCGQTYHAKGSRNEIKIQEIMHIDRTNVGNKMYDYTGNKRSHQNGNK
jgi:hypothetical protein